MAVAGGGEHKEDRIISVRVLLRRCPFAGPVTDSCRLSLYPLSFPLYSLVADLIAAESVRCSYAEEGHAACEGAGEHEKRPAAAARKLRRAARRDDDHFGSGRALSQRTYRRD